MKSKGMKRNLASLLAFISAGMLAVPTLAPYAEYVSIVAGVLGGVGLIHAAGAGTLTVK